MWRHKEKLGKGIVVLDDREKPIIFAHNIPILI